VRGPGSFENQHPTRRTPIKKPNPSTVYLILEFSTALIFSLIFTVNMVYQATVVRLTPLQLVLMGTILEGTVFLFEIPTGVLADVKSRKLSVVIGYVLMGAGFLLEGSAPYLWSVALAQVAWGFGYTFTSGATQAWIADEVGDEQAAGAFLRGSQAGNVGALVAIPISMAKPESATKAMRIPSETAGSAIASSCRALLWRNDSKNSAPTAIAQKGATMKKASGRTGAAADGRDSESVHQVTARSVSIATIPNATDARTARASPSTDVHRLP